MTRMATCAPSPGEWARSSDRKRLDDDQRGISGASYTPVSADIGMYLRATASYSDGEGSGKSAEVVSGASVADQEADAAALGQHRSFRA